MDSSFAHAHNPSNQMIPAERSQWLGRLANLNVATTGVRGLAPHKPLMLLAVMDLIETGDVGADGSVCYDVRLVSRFRDYWELVLDRQRNAPDIPMPFHALGGAKDRIWTRHTADGAPSAAKQTTRLCRLDPGLHQLLQNAAFRNEARRNLVSVYFTPKEQVMLCARLGLPLPKTEEIADLRSQADDFRASQRKGRDSRFKSEVLSGYFFTCALTGYRLDTESGSLVQAAHIHQHAESENDDPDNGLALTPDAHWMFDAGLWTAEPRGKEFTVRVAKGCFVEFGPVHHSRLLDRDGSPLWFDDRARIRPNPVHFGWHQRNRFLCPG
jgi:putative restriction endonuclease